MPESAASKDRINFIVHSTNWIFQRFNYFLIGVAFLVTALATIWSSQQYSIDPVSGQAAWFLRALCLSGYFLSVFFAYINYSGSVELKNLWNTLYDEPDMLLNDWVIKPWTHKHNIWADLKGIISPAEKRRQPASHTYLVPMFFAVFWFGISLLLLPCTSVPDWWVWWLGTCLVLLIVIPGLFYGVHCLRSRSHMKSNHQ